MSQSERVQLFDHWAENCDATVTLAKEFPFDGYEQVSSYGGVFVITVHDRDSERASKE